jgi:hypothetical protein
MLPGSFKLWILSAVLMLCSIFAAGAAIFAQQTPSADSAQAPPSDYLPPGRNEVSILAVMLRQLGEPSLFKAAKDKNAISYRATFFVPTPGHETVIRLHVGADGSGTLVTAVSSGADFLKRIDRTKNEVSAAEVGKFLRFVDQTEFWSAASHDNSVFTDGAGRRTYVFDAPWWMLEGVRNGSFHYIVYRNEKPDSITEIGCYLAYRLVAHDRIEVPMPDCR